MRNVVIGAAILFAVLGIAFVVLPMDTLAFLPNGIAFALSVVALFLAKGHKKIKMLSWIVLAVSVLAILIAIGKATFEKDKVVPDKKFEQVQKQTEKDDVKDLENLQ